MRFSNRGWRRPRRLWIPTTVFIAASIAGTPAPGRAEPIVFFGSGSTAAAIQPSIDAFLAAVGGANNGGNACTPAPCPNGFRRITWDGGGPNSPDPLPGDAFNQPAGTPGRERGLTVATEPGAHFEVSAVEGQPGFEFGTVNAQYPSLFQPFSDPKLFAPIGSVITDVTFSPPGQPGVFATTSAFAVVFTDVDLAENSGLGFFDLAGNLRGIFFAPPRNNGLSFVGVSFGESIIAGVRIVNGNVPLGPNTFDGFFDDRGVVDAVALDDFFYAEPIAAGVQPAPVPEPTSLLLLATGLAGTIWRRRRRECLPARSVNEISAPAHATFTSSARASR